jgi:hypothetical protein
VDVPDWDAEALGACGWELTAEIGIGTTAQRPVFSPNQQVTGEYHDTTLAAFIFWDGLKWRNCITSAVV